MTRYTDREPIPALNGSLHLIGSHNVGKPSCRECIDFLSYDVDGTSYACHLFSPLVTGIDRAITMSDFEKDESLSQYGGTEDPSCIDCPLCSWCPTCYGFNYLFTGSTGTRDHRICKMIFAQAFAASEYQIRHYSSVGITKATAGKAKAAVRAYRVLRGDEHMLEILSVRTGRVCPSPKSVGCLMEIDRKEVAV